MTFFQRFHRFHLSAPPDIYQPGSNPPTWLKVRPRDPPGRSYEPKHNLFTGDFLEQWSFVTIVATNNFRNLKKLRPLLTGGIQPFLHHRVWKVNWPQVWYGMPSWSQLIIKPIRYTRRLPWTLLSFFGGWLFLGYGWLWRNTHLWLTIQHCPVNMYGIHFILCTFQYLSPSLQYQIGSQTLSVAFWQGAFLGVKHLLSSICNMKAAMLLGQENTWALTWHVVESNLFSTKKLTPLKRISIKFWSHRGFPRAFKRAKTHGSNASLPDVGFTTEHVWSCHWPNWAQHPWLWSGEGGTVRPFRTKASIQWVFGGLISKLCGENWWYTGTRKQQHKWVGI